VLIGQDKLLQGSIFIAQSFCQLKKFSAQIFLIIYEQMLDEHKRLFVLAQVTEIQKSSLRLKLEFIYTQVMQKCLKALIASLNLRG